MSFVILVAKAGSVLRSILLGDRNEWTSAVMTWSRLQTELACKENTGITSSPDLRAIRKREEEPGSPQQEDDKGGDGESRRLGFGEESNAQTLHKKRKAVKDKSGIEGMRADRKWKEETSEEAPEQQTLENKRRRHDEEERRGAASHSSHGRNVEKDNASERSRPKEEEQMGKFIGFSGAISGIDFSGGSAPLDHRVESSRTVENGKKSTL